MPTTPLDLARRLQAAREALHMRQEDAARHLGVSRSTLVQIELGNRTVSSLELDKLAALYGRDIRDFFAEEERPEGAVVAMFRLHPDVSAQEEVQVALRESMALGRAISGLERILGIERERGVLPTYPLPVTKSRWHAVQQGEQVAAEERRRLELGVAPVFNLTEVLETQGVRTAQLELPEDLSGLTLIDPEIGPFVVVNSRLPGHSRVRQRFSFAHEYCHVLLDRELRGTISRASDRSNLLEVRANAFAAAFLMPAAGVQEFVQRLGKGRASRLQTEVFDEEVSQRVQARPDAARQAIQMHDVVLLAHHFGTSRLAALYRLKSLGLLSQHELDALKQQEDIGMGKAVAGLLDLSDADHETDSEERSAEFRHRFLALALEAFRLGEITRAKLGELAEMVGVSSKALDGVLAKGEFLAAGDGDDEPRT